MESAVMRFDSSANRFCNLISISRYCWASTSEHSAIVYPETRVLPRVTASSRGRDADYWCAEYCACGGFSFT